MTNTEQKIDALTLEQVEQVYVSRYGKQHQCCCGCSGKYYKTGVVDGATDHSIKMVKKIFYLLKSAADTAEDFGGGFSVVINNREYNVYVKEAK